MAHQGYYTNPSNLENVNEALAETEAIKNDAEAAAQQAEDAVANATLQATIAQSAANGALASENSAFISSTSAQTYAGAAQAAASDAESNANIAAIAEGNATNYANQAQAYRDEALAYKNLAEVEANDAEYWAGQAAATVTGQVFGPASAVDNEIPRFDGTTGKLIKAGLKYQASVTDTTSGALALVGAFGLGTIGIATSDLDSITTPGFYKSSSSATGSPIASVLGYNVYYQGDASFGTMVAIGYDGGKEFVRIRQSGTWGSWAEVMTSNNVITSQTDTTAGRLLLNGSHGLGATAPVIPSNDYNDLADYNGYARNNNSVAAINYPPQLGGSNVPMAVHNVRFNNAYGWQLGTITNGASPSDATLRMFLRNEVNGTWSNWGEVYNSRNQGNLFYGGTSAYTSLAVNRLDQSGAGNSDNAVLDVGSGNGHARLSYSSTTGGTIVRGLTVPRTGTPNWWDGTTFYNLFNGEYGGQVVKDTGSIGFGTGAGGSVTQATSKTTAVTLNKPSGRITTAADALAAGAGASFQMNNSTIGATDVVIANVAGTTVNYRIEVLSTTAGVTRLRLTNISAGSLSDAVVINFVVIKGAIA